MKNLEKFEDLRGHTLVSIKNTGNTIEFELRDGSRYSLNHHQDCCESVSVEDVIGDLQDLVGSPLLMAEEATSSQNPDGYKPCEYQDSFTWTFYKLATIKGYVTIRFYGESNGYYSESVDFDRIS